MPNDYDRIIKENFEPLLPHLCRALLGLDLSNMEPLAAKIQVTTKRELDNLRKVVHADHSLDYGLHWEIQTDDEDMRSRNLLYYALAHHATGLPIKQIVLYVGDQKPRLILQNALALEGVRLEFVVVNIREIPKERFLESQVPEEVVLALLCDFGQDRPEKVVRMILDNLLKIIGRVERLKKYQRQLQVLSRLRKLQPIVRKEISLMPVKFDIETDELYLEGIGKGVEKHQHDTVVRCLRTGVLSLEMIANLAGVTLEYVHQVQRELSSQAEQPS